MKKIIYIKGMSCGHCVNHVKEALSELDGVLDVKVSLEDKKAEIEMESEVSNEKIKEAIEELEFKVLDIK